MLTNDERKFLLKTEEDLKRVIRRIDSMLAVDATSNYEDTEDHYKNEESFVTQYLINLGMPTAINGFGYVRSGILFILAEKNRKILVMKELYPKIAEECNSTPQKVERGIRTAIERTVDNQTEELIDLLHGSRREKPTNSEFMALVTEKIRLEL